MKATDIKEYEIGNHCYGDIMRINGKDYEDLSREEVLELIHDMLTNDINSGAMVREVLGTALSYLPFDMTESDHTTCDQCGNWNQYSHYTNPDCK
jgi:hypothetical protein